MKKALYAIGAFLLASGNLFAQTGTWTHFNAFNSGLPFSSPVLSIAFDKQDRVWFGTDGGGLARLDPDLSTWTLYKTTNSSLPSNGVYSVAVDKKGVVWAATAAGVAKIDNGVWTVFGATFSGAPLSGKVNHVAVDSANRKWFCINNGGIASYNDTTWSYTQGNATPPAIQFAWFQAFHPNGTRYMALSTTSSGIWYKQNPTAAWAQYTSGSTPGLANNEIRWIDVDAQGLTWFGTGAGITQLQNGTFSTQSVGGANDPQTVTCVHKDKLGILWAGTYGSFSSPTFRFANGAWTKLTQVVGNESINSAADIKEDRLGRIWIGCSSGAFLFTRTTEASTLLSHNRPISISPVREGKVRIVHDQALQEVRCFDVRGRLLSLPCTQSEGFTEISGLPSEGLFFFHLTDGQGKRHTLRTLPGF